MLLGRGGGWPCETEGDTLDLECRGNIYGNFAWGKWKANAAFLAWFDDPTGDYFGDNPDLHFGEDKFDVPMWP